MSGLQTCLRLALVAGTLAGCGGGNGGVSSPPTVADQQFLAVVTQGGELKLFDPQARTTHAAIDTGLDVARGQPAFRSILGGSYRYSDNTLADPHHLAVAYLKGGKIFRLSLSKAGLPVLPVPVQVSSIADACGITERLFDFADPLQTRLLVSTAGTDTNCGSGDDQRHYVALGADASTPASLVPATAVIGASLHGVDGALEHVLVQEGPADTRALRRYDANLQDSVLVTDLEPSTAVAFGGPAPSGAFRYLRLRVKDAPFTHLHSYTASSNSLASFSLPDSGTLPLAQLAEADATHIYYPIGQKVYRLTHDFSQQLEIRDAGTGVSIRNLRLTPGRVILHGERTIVNPDNSTSKRYHLETVPRSGGTPVSLAADSTFTINISAVADNRVYFQGSGGAAAMLDDGSGGPVAGSWGGFSQAPSRVSIGGTEIFLDTHHGLLTRSTGVSGANTVDFNSFNARSGSGLAALGTIRYVNSTATTPSFGRYRLLAVTILRSSPFELHTDVYFADTHSGNSLALLATSASGRGWTFQ